MLEEFKNAFNRPNNGHIQLIIINVVVFVVMGILYVIATVSRTDGFFMVLHNQFAIPPRLADFIQRPWTLITYAFMHDLRGIMHILFNMLFLYWFGKLFVEYLGGSKVVALYLLGALAAGITYLVVFNTIPYFKGIADFPGMIGASGAVYAVMVATATLIPDYTFFLLFIGPVRIKYIAGFLILVSFLGSVGGNAGGNIAHLGGALMGYVYVKQLQVGVNWGGWITATLDWISGWFSPRSRVKVSYRKESAGAARQQAKPGAISQQEIDAILDKISEGGYESLSKEEREKLFKASKK